jgi:hypothetical protein
VNNENNNIETTTQEIDIKKSENYAVAVHNGTYDVKLQYSFTDSTF